MAAKEGPEKSFYQWGKPQGNVTLLVRSNTAIYHTYCLVQPLKQFTLSFHTQLHRLHTPFHPATLNPTPHSILPHLTPYPTPSCHTRPHTPFHPATLDPKAYSIMPHQTPNPIPSYHTKPQTHSILPY